MALWLDSFSSPVVISVTKEGIKFATTGDIGTANIVCRQNTTVDKVRGTGVRSLLQQRFLITEDSSHNSQDVRSAKQSYSRWFGNQWG